MNRAAIEIAEYAWNPVTGCQYQCDYCHARRQAVRFSGDIRENILQAEKWNEESGLYVLHEAYQARNDRHLNYPYGFSPTLHRYRMGWLEKIKRSANILVCPMGDLFGNWVPEEWIVEVLEACKACPRHNYIFLTRNPSRYISLERSGILPSDKNFWYGSTITGQFDEFCWSTSHNSFVNAEPILSSFEFDNESILAMQNEKWAVLGAMTGPKSSKRQPKKEWVEAIVRSAKESGVPVFMKESLRELMGDGFIQEFPEHLMHKDTKSALEHERQDAACALCGRFQVKSSMRAVLGKRKRCDSSETICHICDACASGFPEMTGLTQPKEATCVRSAPCSLCGENNQKSEMLTIMMRRRRGESAEVKGYVCANCEDRFIKKLTEGENSCE